MKRILIVDDEVQILKAMSRLFMEADYLIYTAESGADALTLLAENEIDLIICDMRMPLMSGNELLSIVKDKYPNIIRVILSGYADERSMFKALLHNIAKLYIFKPWNNSELVGNMEKLFATDALLHSRDLVQSIENISYKVKIPEKCQKLIPHINNEDMDALITEIENEPEISALLMQVARCSIYGVMPNSVRLVANYVGMQNLKSFLYWASVTVSDSKLEMEDGEMAILWKQSCDTNRILLFLYEACLHKQPPEAALFAGLLKNIGYIILLRSNLSEYHEALMQKEGKSQYLINLESENFKVSHQEVGAYYLNQWDLPYPAVEVALYHHRPLDANIINTELVACVHIAQHYSWKLLNGGVGTELNPEAFNRIGITAKAFEDKLAKYLK
jgi:response regulator RpfG family c-di-GMP phosphodiesterase